ncbi:MAG: endonuclease/exonuclease/phosphatase family protein [Candidatus Binataceae bacterium]
MESSASLLHARAGEAPPYPPMMVNRPPMAIRRTLKAVVLNAHGGLHLDGILRCLRRSPLKDADVILLCEADFRMRRSQRREVAAEMAAALGMSMVYQPEFGVSRESGAPISFIGNSILCSQPLSEVSSIPLPGLKLKRRMRWLVGCPCGVSATAVFNGRRITIGVAHLNSRWNPEGRARQMAHYLAAIPDAAAVLIGGDFNTTTVDLRDRRALLHTARRMIMNPRRFHHPESYEPLFEHLSEAGFEIDGANALGRPTFTFARALPPWLRPKLDWIALKGLNAVGGSARVVAARPSFVSRRLSDHDFLVCEAKL